MKKPKDCNCAFPNVIYYNATKHAEWCQAHKRLMAKRLRKESEGEEERQWAENDELGRYLAGVGPRPDWYKGD